MKRKRVFTPLVISAVALVVAALGFQAWVLHQGRQRALDLMSIRAANRAQATAHQIESVLKQTDLVLRDIRRHLDAEEVQMGPSARTAARAGAMRSMLREWRASLPHVLHLHVVSADGRYVYSTHDTVPSANLSDRAYFRQQIRGTEDRLVVSEPLVGRVTGRWGVYPSRRLTTKEGRFAGIVLAAIDAESLGSVMVAVDQQAWTLALLNDSGHLVARVPARETILGQSWTHPGLSLCQRRGNARFEGPGCGESRPMLWAAQRLDNLPLTTVAGFSREQALSQWQRDLRINLGMAILLIGGCSLILAFHWRNQRNALELKALEERLQQAHKLDALGQLAGGVAHDFNNMLAAILASAELLESSTSDAHQQKLSRTIVSAAKRASGLTRKLLDFARKGKIVSVPVDVHSVIHEAVALMERTFDRRIAIQLRLKADRWQVIGDPAQLQNAVLNLGLNARDAMPEGGTLILSTQNLRLTGDQCVIGPFHLEPGAYLEVSVADSGCGIPPEHLPKVFDPFFTTKEVHAGTGLGLATVIGTLASHKGAVKVQSRVGAGSVFRLFLPLAPPSGAPAHSGPQPAAQPGSGRIMVVEDEDLVRESTVLQLRALGYEVLEEGDPRAAVARFRNHHTELSAVILDMVMPHLSGAELAEILREIDPGVPLILASGFTRNAEVDQLLQKGLAGFLQKPFSLQDLGEILARIGHATPNHRISGAMGSPSSE